MPRGNRNQASRRRAITSELVELAELRGPERREASGGPGTGDEAGATGNLPRIADEAGATVDLPRIADEAGATTDLPRIQVDPEEVASRPTRTREERRSRRHGARSRAARRRVERLADWLLVLGGVALAVSLFLPWSHQFSATLLARYGSSPLLRGVPRSPDAWQVYSIVDALLALLAGALVVTALVGGRTARLVLTGFVLIALAFTVHAVNVAPTNGANIVNTAVSPATYLPNSPRPGGGEDLALVALGIAVAGLALSVPATG